ncbi:MAG: sigma 54-interacting transcriptional regulator, partial [Bacteroidota bacterium]
PPAASSKRPIRSALASVKADRMGRFELAAGGSLFLDEIGNLDLPFQAKLLSALQNRTVTRLGSNKEIPVDIRLICATNIPILEMVQQNKFRQDLLYRINTVEITLPPLRERIGDIPLLVQHFLKIYKKKYHKYDLKIDPSAMRALEQFNWPGNIRELRHAVERAVILCDGVSLNTDDFLLSNTQQGQDDMQDLDNYNLETIERWGIRKVLTKHAGNISKAADELGLTRATLYRRMEKYGL